MGHAFFRNHRAGVSRAGLTIMDRFAEELPAALSLQSELVSIPSSFLAETFKKLLDAVYKMLPWKEVLRDENNCTLWNLIVNAGVKSVDERSINNGYCSTHPKHNCSSAYLRLQLVCGLLFVLQS